MENSSFNSSYKNWFSNLQVPTLDIRDQVFKINYTPEKSSYKNKYFQNIENKLKTDI